MTCKDCICYGKCRYDVYFSENIQYQNCNAVEYICEGFEDKTLYIKLPCKVGDKIYCLYRNVIEEHTVEEFMVGNLAIWVYARKANGFPSYFSSAAIGHGTYLSFEEAAKALKEKDGENNE